MDCNNSTTNALNRSVALNNSVNNNIITYIRIKDSDSKTEHNREHIRIQNKIYQADKIITGPSQEELFLLIKKSILEKCTKGYNCSIFAYGQTGSGKTYTIQGNETNPGLVQRALEYLHGIYDNLKLSFIEIYNENMIDLFNNEGNSSIGNSIGIRDDPTEGIIVDNLTILNSTNIVESLKMYEKGVSGRRTSATNMNSCSSRSHSIFTVFLEFKDRNVIKKSKLCFVDLAGSEKYKDNKEDRDIENSRVKETCNINKSLLCLGKIVHKLGTNEKWHISYRDSKLTFLLKDSLGGNSKLAIIGNVNTEYLSDTINTLEFLKRSKMITNNPSINYDLAHSSVEELTENLKILDEENQALKEELTILRKQQEGGVRNSLIYSVKLLKTDVEFITNTFKNIKNKVGKIIDDYFDENRKIIMKINKSFNLISNERRENINNININDVKKRKI